MLNTLSYQPEITQLERKISDYNNELKKPLEERSIFFQITNLTSLKTELLYYQKWI